MIITDRWIVYGLWNVLRLGALRYILTLRNCFRVETVVYILVFTLPEMLVYNESPYNALEVLYTNEHFLRS